MCRSGALNTWIYLPFNLIYSPFNSIYSAFQPLEAIPGGCWFLGGADFGKDSIKKIRGEFLMDPWVSLPAIFSAIKTIFSQKNSIRS